MLVAPGAYHEFLVGPTHSFALFGTSIPDSTNQALWTILDPISQPDADTPSALTLFSDTVLVKNFVFFNRPEMRQYDWPTRTGGVLNNADILNIQDCRFDSVSGGINEGQLIVLLRTTFQGCLWRCVWTSEEGRLDASNSSFDGNGYSMILAHDYSHIDSCRFTCNPNGHFVGLFGEGLRVTNCEFGPCVGSTSTMFLYVETDVVIEGCTFTGIDRVPIILEADVVCTESDLPPIIVRGNKFQIIIRLNLLLA